YLKSKSLISLLHPFERGRDASVYFLLTKIAALWSVVVLFSIYVAVGFHFDGFLATMRNGEFADRVAALGSSSYLVTLCCIVAFNFSQLIHLTAIVPLTRFFSDRRRRMKSHKLDFFNHAEI